HVHDLLAVGVLRWRDSFHNPHLAGFPMILWVPVRPVVQVHYRELGIPGSLLVPGFPSGVSYRQDPPLTQQLVLWIPGRVSVEDLDIIVELISTADRVHPGTAG